MVDANGTGRIRPGGMLPRLRRDLGSVTSSDARDAQLLEEIVPGIACYDTGNGLLCNRLPQTFKCLLFVAAAVTASAWQCPELL